VHLLVEKAHVLTQHGREGTLAKLMRMEWVGDAESDTHMGFIAGDENNGLNVEREILTGREDGRDIWDLDS
jgi:hypothetical protein